MNHFEQPPQENKEKNSVESGKSFLSKLGENVAAGLKFYFSFPKGASTSVMDKIINVACKTIEPLGSALFVKAAILHRWSEFVSPHDDKMIMACCITFAIATATMTAVGLFEQHDRNKWYEEFQKKLNNDFKPETNNSP